MNLQAFAPDDYAMEILKAVAWVVGIFSSIVFIALFGRLPIFRRTPIGWTHRLLLERIPSALIALDRHLTGKRITRTITRLYNYLMYERHPVVMIIFITLQVASEIAFLPLASPFLPTWHKVLLLPLLLAAPYITLYLTYATSAHHITRASYPAALRRYPYDYTLYHPHQRCSTCTRPKPARSKHCSICNACIERQDHHCVWVNNCVGLHNHGYFVALLLSISLLLLYGAHRGFAILDALLQERYVPAHLTRGSISAKRWATGLSWHEWLNRWAVVVAMNARVGAVTLLAAMTFPMALGFLVYHAYLIWGGFTTNETGKWTDLREDVWDALVWKARIAEMLAEYPGPLDERVVYDALHFEDPASMRGRRPSWPKREEWWLVRTRGGAQPRRAVGAAVKRVRHDIAAPAATAAATTGSSGPPRQGMSGVSNGAAVAEEQTEVDDRWTRVKKMKEVDNLYDLGLMGNIKDILWRRLEE